jgi:hypothetical protein
MIWKLKVQTIWIIVFILFFFLLQISIIFSNFKLYKKNSHYNQGFVLYKSLLQFKNENFLLQNELGGISYDFDQKITFWKLVNSFKMMK